MQQSSSIPRIYADFNNCDREGRVRLNCIGSRADLDRLGITLSEGMDLMVSDAELEVEAVATFVADDSIWAAVFDPQRLRDVKPPGD
jgi:hypothetical protein